MGDVARLLSENLLEGAALRAFHKDRGRVARRHANWRRNFPAVGLLLDSDEERAQALAGNFATEGRETVGVWLSVQGPEPPSSSDIEDRVAWIDEFWNAWRADSFDAAGFEAYAEGPRQSFTVIFDDLMQRFRDDAVTFVREAGSRDSERRSLLGRSMAPLGALGRALEGFFFPSVRRR